VVRLDRLGRSLAELLSTVAQLRERGIALLSLEEKIDTSSAAGELVFHVFGAIAHFERRLISERTKDGIAAARARGKHPGRQPLDMAKVEAALKLVEAGISPAEAAKQLGIGRSTVYREMRRLGVRRP
jgi:DNA invertase Pin-like site-specific DNA recombinase